MFHLPVLSPFTSMSDVVLHGRSVCRQGSL